jgi:hypothetical protein
MAVAVHTSAVVGHTSAADKLGLVAPRPGAGRAHPPWLGADPDRVYVVGRRAMEPVHSSPADIVAISGTAVGGIMASARAGYGRTITVSTCGPATKVFATPTSRELAAPNKSRRASPDGSSPS